MKFPLGQVVATPGALHAIALSDVSVDALLERHQSGDWGECCEEDAASNDLAVAQDLRVLSVYKAGTATVWVITEWDRSVTTLLLPSEY